MSIDLQSDQSSIYEASIHPTESDWSNPESYAYAETVKSGGSLAFHNRTEFSHTGWAPSLKSSSDNSGEGNPEADENDDAKTVQDGQKPRAGQFYFGYLRRNNTKKMDIRRWVQYVSHGQPESYNELVRPIVPISQGIIFKGESSTTGLGSNTVQALQINENIIHNPQVGIIHDRYLSQENMVPDHVEDVLLKRLENLDVEVFQGSGYESQENVASGDISTARHDSQENDIHGRMGGIPPAPYHIQENIVSDEHGIAGIFGTTKTRTDRNENSLEGEQIPQTDKDPKTTFQTGTEVFLDIIERFAGIGYSSYGFENETLYLKKIEKELSPVYPLPGMIDYPLEVEIALATHSYLVQSSLEMIREKRYRDAVPILSQDLDILCRIWSIFICDLQPYRFGKKYPTWDTATKRERTPKLYMCKMEIFLLLAYIEVKSGNHLWAFKHLDQALEFHPSIAGRVAIALLQGMMVLGPQYYCGQHIAMLSSLGGDLQFISGENLLLLILRICEGERVKMFLDEEETSASTGRFARESLSRFSGVQKQRNSDLCFHLVRIAGEEFSKYFMFNGLQGSPMYRYVAQVCNSASSMANKNGSGVFEPWHFNDYIGSFMNCLQDLDVSNEFEIPFDWTSEISKDELWFHARPTYLFDAPYEIRLHESDGSFLVASRMESTSGVEEEMRVTVSEESFSFATADSNLGHDILNNDSQVCNSSCPGYFDDRGSSFLCGTCYNLRVIESAIPGWPSGLTTRPNHIMRCLLTFRLEEAMYIVNRWGTAGVDDALKYLVQAEYQSQMDADLGIWWLEQLVFLGADTLKIQISEMVRLHGYGITYRMSEKPQARVYRTLLSIIDRTRASALPAR